MVQGSALNEWLYSCVRCGNCKYVFRDYGPSCPSGEYFQLESYFASGRLWVAHALLKGDLAWSSDLLQPLFACSTCGACEVQCLAPHKNSIVEMIEELRAEAVDALGPLPSHRKFRDRIKSNHNPYGSEHHARSLVERHSLPLEAPLVYFVGCTANYRETEIRDATISLLKKGGMNFTIVDEYCCSSPLIRTGQLDLPRDLAQHNCDRVSEAGASRVVTSCAGCYRALTMDYPRLGVSMDFEVIHITHLIREMLESGSLKPKAAEALAVTYHDPCHLGRHCGEYDAPREVMGHLPVRLVEMDYIRENAWCCGAGGGARSAFSDWSLKTASSRLQMALETGAQYLVSACPFCKRNLNDASEGNLKVLDLSELADRLTQ